MSVLERFPWPLPDPLDWSHNADRRSAPPMDFSDPGCMDSEYRRFWSAVETSQQDNLKTHGLACPRASLGRAVRTAPQRRVFQCVPPKLSRPGDKQPAFLGSCLQHVRWTRQVRRLRSLSRLLSADTLTLSHREHAVSLWNAILRSPGFPRGFVDWWRNRNHALGELPVIPLQVPSAAQVRLILLGFEFELDLLEVALNKSRKYADRVKRASDPYASFATVKRVPPAQVASLLTSVHAVITQVEPEDGSVSFDQEHIWLPDAPMMHTTGQVDPIVATPDRLWLQDVEGFAVGDTITQTKIDAELPVLFSAFEEQWKTLWGRHDAVPASQWTDIVGFAQAVLPPRTCPPVVHDPASLKWTVGRKKKRAATGLDGVSRMDFLSLTNDELQTIVRLFDAVESHGTWPSQMMSASVRSLSKVPDPTRVTHFRPITILSTLYRAWSSVSSQHWLAQLGPVLDPWLCGNRSGYRAASAWQHVMSQIEIGRSSGVPVSGLVLDLVKAFNLIPRLPALHACKLLGMAQPSLIAWAGALSQVRRHFLVQGSCSNGVLSSCGVPEGCGMSCVAMAALTQVFHCWVRRLDVRCQAITYVDDWQVLLFDDSAVQRTLDRIDQFISMLDMRRDHAKTYVWSTDPVVRKQLREEGFVVQLKARALGAHVVYSRQLSNGTLLARIQDLDSFWQAIQSFRGTYRQKVKLITQVAWPRALHACSAVVLGRKRLLNLRTEVMRALRCDKPGVNPMLQCILEGPLCDPQLYLALETFRDFRSLDPVNGSCALGLTASGSLHLDWNSVHEILVQRLHQLGFDVGDEGLIRDALGVFDLVACSIPELLIRMQRQWVSVLASQLRHRATFVDFARVDLFATRAAYMSLSPFDQGVMRRWHTGAFLANDVAWRWSSSASKLCTHCSAADSPEHRLWHCPASSHLRAAVTPSLLASLRDLPLVCSLHGWTLASPAEPLWLRYLVDIPAQPVFESFAPADGLLHFFTDGACHCPAMPSCRVAAWSVVYSPPVGDSPTVGELVPVAAQPLSGIIQTIFRAELMAVVAACELACRLNRPAVVWSDCLGVVRRFRAHVCFGAPVRNSQAHSDLWQWLVDLLTDRPRDFVVVKKVAAHCSQEGAESAIDDWLSQGNNSADRAAKAANASRGPAVWTLWERMVSEQYDCSQQGATMRWLILEVSKLWGAKEVSAPEVRLVQPQPTRVTREFEKRWENEFGFELAKPSSRRFFGATVCGMFQTWFTSVVDAAAPIRWISFVQLYFSFQLKHQPVSILKRSGKWQVVVGVSARLQNHVPILTRIKSFRLAIQQFLKDCRVQFNTASLRPSSDWVACHRGCLSLPFCQSEWLKVEQALAKQLTVPSNGQGKALASLHDP